MMLTGSAGGAGRGRGRMPLSHSLSASQWMPRSTWAGSSGWRSNARSRFASVSSWRRPAKQAEEHRSRRVVRLDRDGDAVVRRGEAKMVLHRHCHEGGDVELLGAALPVKPGVGIGDRDEVAMTLPEGVVDLVKHSAQ